MTPLERVRKIRDLVDEIAYDDDTLAVSEYCESIGEILDEMERALDPDGWADGD